MKEIPFPENRYRHCYGVGRRMYEYARDVLHWNEKRCGEMFVLGNLHDIGYELDPDAFGHDLVLANILSGSYKYAGEIRYHSALQDELLSEEMKLLYFADATVDGYGRFCTLDERLADLKERHGENSEVYKESVRIAEKVREWGFDDTIGVKE